MKFTRVPNLDLQDMGQAELKVTLALLAEQGWYREEPAMSYTDLEAATGMARPSVVKGVKLAVERGRLRKLDIKGPGGVNLYEVQYTDRRDES